MKNILYALLLLIPSALPAQDTLIATIKIYKTGTQYVYDYAKDIRYSDVDIINVLAAMFHQTIAVVPKEPKINCKPNEKKN